MTFATHLQALFELAYQFLLLVGQVNRGLSLTLQNKSPAGPPRTEAAPLPRKRKTLPDCVPAGIFRDTSPDSVGTSAVSPSNAVARLIGISQRRWAPSRSNIWWARTLTST